MKKRVSVFAFYDKDGIVDDYIVHLLKEMKKEVAYQYVIVNGIINKNGEEKLSSVCDEIIIRENKGLDVSGYKEVILSRYEKLKEFDEVLFFNQTVFGPFYPFKELFDKMDNSACDFFGLTRYPKRDEKPEWVLEGDCIPAHLQSYFLVVRKNMFSSTLFKDFFENLTEINSYFDAVSKFEMRFTKYFEDNGFVSDCYLKTDRFIEYSDYPLIGNPVELIENDRCPLAKRKSFLLNRSDILTFYYGKATQDLYNYINEKTEYKFDLIKENLLRTVDYKTLMYSLTPCFLAKDEESKEKDTITLIYIKNDFAIDYIKDKLQEIKENSDIVIVLNDEKLINEFAEYKTIISNEMYKTLFNELIRTIKEYKYVLYITNDIGEIYSKTIDLNSLKNAFETIGRINSSKKILKENKDYSLLITYPSYKGSKFTRGMNWDKDLEVLQGFFKQNNIDLPLNKAMEPIVAESGMFFAKTSILKELNYINEYEFKNCNIDFKEVIMPILAQISGGFTGFVFNENNHFSDLLNLDYMLMDFKNVCKDEENKRFDTTIASLQGKLDHFEKHHNDMTLRQAFDAKLSLKEKLYIIYHLIFNKSM